MELSGEDLEPVVLYIDPGTFRVSRQTHVPGGAGDPMIEERFSDYREVDGIWIAFAAEVRRGGERIIERRVTEIAINPSLDPSLFQRPAS